MTLGRSLATPHKLQGPGSLGKHLPRTARVRGGRREGIAGPCRRRKVVRPHEP